MDGTKVFQPAKRSYFMRLREKSSQSYEVFTAVLEDSSEKR
jgi:hypothetical protein